MDEYKQYKQAYTGTTTVSDGTPSLPPHAPPNELSEKDRVHKKQKTNADSVDDGLNATFTLRIPFSLYKKYYELNGSKKRIVREALRNFFIYIVDNIASIERASISVSSNTAVYNFNVNVNVVSARAEASAGGQDDEFYKEKMRLMKERLKTAEDVLKEYKRRFEEVRMISQLMQQAIQARDWVTTSKLLKKMREVVG